MIIFCLVGYFLGFELSLCRPGKNLVLDYYSLPLCLCVVGI